MNVENFRILEQGHCVQQVLSASDDNKNKNKVKIMSTNGKEIRKSVRDLVKDLQLNRNSTNNYRAGTEFRRSMGSLGGTSTKISWKGSGYCNQEFQKIKLIKNKMLSAWEIERMGLADRTYQAPKNYKGFKTGIKEREFSKPPYKVYNSHKTLANEKQYQKMSMRSQFQFGKSESLKNLKFHRARDTLFGFNNKL